jgi:DHA1 family tetracycline resistance protein-like MFS transporter
MASKTGEFPLVGEVERPKLARTTVPFLLMTAFLNLAGIGIINPVAPFVVGQYVAQENVAFVVGLIFTTYSFFQFLAVPTLGALSDRYGRRPILLVSLLGSAVGYLLYGIGGAVWMLFLGRAIDGLTGGNIATINAYAADISKPEDRTKFFALLGAAAGMGFVVGPALGGLLYRLTDSYNAPVFFAAGVSLLNAFWGFYVMPESLPPDKRAAKIPLAKLNPLSQLTAVFSIPHLRLLLASVFLVTVGFTLVAANFSTLARDRLAWTPDTIGIGFLVWGVVSIFVQGYLIRRLLPVWGESRLSLAGLALMIIGFLMVAGVTITGNIPLAFAGIIVSALGNSLVTPSMEGMVSKAASVQEQGRVQGGSQSVQALGRVVGPLWGGFSYERLGQAAPYISSAIGLAIAGLTILATLPLLRGSREQQSV